jgi:spore coat polysaccharide biosynthesis protein SpsF
LSGNLENKLSELHPHIGIITQARMTSTRLPGKIFKAANHKSLLQYHIDRLKQTGFDIAIATTVNQADNIICDFAERQNVKFHRGSENNVLSRFYETAIKFGFDVIIRVTSDCPLIDPHLIRNSLEKYLKFNNENLYMSNGIERTFARGFDFEIFSFSLLKDAFENAKEESDLEHVTPYIWKNRSGKVEFYHVKQETNNSDLRITADTADDFDLIQKLIEQFNAAELSYNEIEKILRDHPELIAINSHIEQKKV